MKNDSEVTGDLAIFVADTETKIQRTAAYGRPDLAHRGVVRLIALLALLVLLLAAPSFAQDGAVDCGNGFHCPKGNACLLEGFCAVVVDVVPGSVPSKTTPGFFCEPGFRESTIQPGKCIPGSYIECPNGLTCAPGYQCAPSGGCTGGPPPTGPMCGSGLRCAEGRICSSRNTCLNPEFFKDCGNGTICTKGAACELGGSGCVAVAPERTRQQPNSR